MGDGQGRRGQHVSDRFDLAGIDLHKRRAAAERTMLECILSDPAKILPAISNIGPEHFSHSDLRTIFCAARVATEAGFGIGDVLALARRALKAARWWNDRQPAGSRGSTWSDAMLIELAQAEVPNVALAEIRARKLLDIIRRQDTARRHFDFALATIEGRAA